MHHSDRKKKSGWQGYGDKIGNSPFCKSHLTRRWWNAEGHGDAAFDICSRDYGKIKTGANALKRVFGSQDIMNDIDTAVRSISTYDDVKTLVDACISTENVFLYPCNGAEPLKAKVAVAMRVLSLTVLRVNPSALRWLVGYVSERIHPETSLTALSGLDSSSIIHFMLNRSRINLLHGPKINSEGYLFIQDIPVLVLFSLDMLGSYMTENIMAICLKRLDKTPATYLANAKNDYERTACLKLIGKC